MTVPAGKPGRLLIIDDTELTLRMLSAVVADLGDVFVAKDGASGIAAAHAHLPDVILLDVEMPGMDGYEVCRKLKADAVTAGMAVIFVTAHSSAEHEIHALEAGAVDFIGKPINAPVARARVKTHLMLQQQSQLLRELASRDGLTGLWNRRAFDDLLAREARRLQRSRQPLCLLMVDVDCFKSYNDHYGHPAGDDCLRLVAASVQACARRPADVAARIGGEEFAVLLPEVALDDAAQLARLAASQVEALGIPHDYSEAASHVTVSIGVAAQCDQLDAHQLMVMADRALYSAKAGGRNRIVVA
ncbi:diguanylate cyclase domain-containing protein [Chitinimonas sp.]|uniref:diguanylate cyclase domain-containing protein n=1 Tax=Chitinimonas sp. TaxID=1934313 RepID=UPI0035B2F35D